MGKHQQGYLPMSCSVSGGSLAISTFLSSPVNHDLVCIIPTFLFVKKKNPFMVSFHRDQRSKSPPVVQLWVDTLAQGGPHLPWGCPRVMPTWHLPTLWAPARIFSGNGTPRPTINDAKRDPTLSTFMQKQSVPWWPRILRTIPFVKRSN